MYKYDKSLLKMDQLEPTSRQSIWQKTQQQKRLFICGNNQSEKYELIRKLIIENNVQPVNVFTDRDRPGEWCRSFLRKLYNCSMGKPWSNGIDWNSRLNIFYNIQSINKLDEIIDDVFEFRRNPIVIFDGCNDILSDSELKKKNNRVSRVKALFDSNLTIICISDNFPDNKLKLLEANPFDFIFFSPFIHPITQNTRCRALIDYIFKRQLKKNLLYGLFIHFVANKSDNEFVYLKNEELETLHKGTTSTNDYEDNDDSNDDKSSVWTIHTFRS
jgi:hypothetical protein